MRSLVWLIAVGLLLTAGCDEPEADARPDTPVAEKPAESARPQNVSSNPVANQWVSNLPEFIEYKAPVYASRGLPIFDSLVAFEAGVANVEPYLNPVHPRLRIDWKYMAENTRTMEVSLLDAMNEHLNTALDQAPKGGGVPVFGTDFQVDLVNIHSVARRLYWDATAQDLTAARRDFTALCILLGDRKPLQNANGRPAPAPAAKHAPDTTNDDTLFKGTSEEYGDIAKLRPRTNIRTLYAFWPAPATTKSEYLAADPKPPKIDWSVDMENTPDFDKPQWPQPTIINTRDLHQENEYSKRINQVEVR